MLILICATLALAFTPSPAQYTEWTSTAVTARPHVQAVIPLHRISLRSWPIDSLTLNVNLAGSQSEIGLNPVLVADLIHSQWCSRITSGSAIRYLPLNHYVPSPAATWNLNDSKTAVTTRRVTNWVDDICVVIRPLGHDISSKVSASAWTKRMNVEMGVGLDYALTSMLIAITVTLSAVLIVAVIAIASVKKSTGLAQSAAHRKPDLAFVSDSDGDHDELRTDLLDSDHDGEDSEGEDSEGEDSEGEDSDNDNDEQSGSEADFEFAGDVTRSPSRDSSVKLCEGEFVAVKSHPETGDSVE